MKNFLPLIAILLITAGFYAGRTTAPETIVLGATEAELLAEKKAVLKDNVELHTRLKQPVEWDISVVSAEELTEAMTAVATEYEVTAQDIIENGGNVQEAIKEKLGQQSKLCDNPNSVSTAEPKSFVTPQ